MLHKAQEKDVAGKVILVNGDAACLSFVDGCFDVVCCSHALYKLKGRMRTDALLEMKRVVKSEGQVLIMGPTDSREFLKQLKIQVMVSHMTPNT